MELHINQWGNSLGLRLPKALAKDMGLKAGSIVKAEMVDGKLVIAPENVLEAFIAQANSAISLKELCDQVTEENMPDMADWRDAPPVGKEVW